MPSYVGSQIRKQPPIINTSPVITTANATATDVNVRRAKFTCAGCGKTLKGVCVSTSTGQKFHQTCLKCATCGGPIAGLFAQKRGVYYCSTCTDNNMHLIAKSSATTTNASTDTPPSTT